MKQILSLAIALVPLVLITIRLIANETEAKLAPPVLLTRNVEWGALNPARGAKGPRAGDLWGDRTEKGATGFLVKFSDGFSSPPHIHNVTYRGVVISGLVHNDDPDAAEMWMPPGSFWTQPAGEVHITAAKGENTVAYIEIQDGPYLVLPKEQASDNGERPVNIVPPNFVWLDSSDSTWIDQTVKDAKITFLWGNPQDEQPVGTLVKLPARFAGSIHSQGPDLRAVVIQGRPKYQLHGAADQQTLEPGSYFGSKDETIHDVSIDLDEDCLIYIRTAGKFHITLTKQKR